MATLNQLTSGELYFINETDPRTGAPTGFRKIGIVKDTDRSTRDSSTRLSQHQVSNPRVLTLASVVPSPCVSFLERTMLEQLCTHGFSGEWVLLNDNGFDDAVSTAARKACELSSASSKFRTSFELQEVTSNGQTRPANSRHLDTYLRLKILHMQETTCNATLKTMKEFFRKALHHKQDVQTYVDLTPVSAHEFFDATMFRQKFPDLFERYTMSSAKFCSGPFKLHGSRRRMVEDDSLGEDLSTLISEARTLIDGDRPYEMFGAIHDCFLRIRSALAVCQWEKTFLEAELMVECGEYSGIEGVCTWERGPIECDKTDVERFQVDYPNEYARCLRVRPPRVNVQVTPYARFCFATHGAFL